MAAVFGRTMTTPAESWPRTCETNLKLMALGVMQYAQDYDEMLPRTGVVTASVDDGWARNLQPYLKNYSAYQCPEETTPQVTINRSARLTDYYYNGRLSKVSISRLNTVAWTVLFGDGEAATSNYACASFDHCVGRNIKTAVGKVPREAKLRHTDSVRNTGANYAFADGHVKWLKPDEITLATNGGVFWFING
ncbi:MAG TPA: H-X9-DG-CTERM domain-containing protein [Abditibacteriaceae bacterium]